MDLEYPFQFCGKTSGVYSIYIHVPFCTHRCAYCDFNTYAGQETLIPEFVTALCREIDYIGTRVPGSDKSAHTVFFGGGTPSLLSPAQFDAIFKSIRSAFALTEDAEISIEANPGTVTEEAFVKLRQIGINRISFGVQSANAFELKMLERTHGFIDVINAVKSARKAGIDNINLDLIYGLPEQTMQTWKESVQRILDLHPEHISAYALTLEHGTPFGRWAERGMLPLPDPDLAADMYEWACDVLEKNRFLQYEISNWAKPGRECRHNMQYWRSLSYLAFGPGGHGYANGYRYSNLLRIKSYIERIKESETLKRDLKFPLSPAVVNQHKQTIEDDMSEFMMTGLRLTKDGVSYSSFQQRFGDDLENRYGSEIHELIKKGLIEKTNPPLQNGEGEDSSIRLTRQGRLLGNQVFLKFIS